MSTNCCSSLAQKSKNWSDVTVEFNIEAEPKFKVNIEVSQRISRVRIGISSDVKNP